MPPFHPSFLIQTLFAILARAMILMAFSEFVFVNEGPVLALVRAEDAMSGLLHLFEIIGFYMLPAGLLFALEPRITAWPSAILVGAFVGWSIEGAVVPAVYEAPPISLLWTSIAWHAPVDVWFGMFILPRLLSSKPNRHSLSAVVLAGLLWGGWASWTWPHLILSADEFAVLASVTFGLLAAGYGLLRWTLPKVACGPRLGPALIGLNLLAGALWASAAPIGAAMLAALILLNWVALRGAKSDAPLTETIAPRLLPSALHLTLFVVVASAVYDFAASFGLPIVGEDLAAIAALGGTLIWLAALFVIFKQKWRAP